MSAKQNSQTLNISGGQLTNVQIGGVAGQDLTANLQQQVDQGQAEQPLMPNEVVALINELAVVLRQANLPAAETDKALKHLDVAREETEAPEPDKEFAAKSLQRATTVLKNAGETVDAGTGLWNKVEPIVSKLLPWLGVAASFF
ncbi:MAG: hypothetical protein HC851_02255 [Acaryochloris sp. RU_4_1]|nr:hypothetical protein [Acaryochloris sp. RU_4_1]NJR56411.1 hypothetical protein [Acaryochloris sp. CRU_2_0]